MYSSFKDTEEIADSLISKEAAEDFTATMHGIIFTKDFTDQISGVIDHFDIILRVQFTDDKVKDLNSLSL